MREEAVEEEQDEWRDINHILLNLISTPEIWSREVNLCTQCSNNLT
jgi:hypothetical protein